MTLLPGTLQTKAMVLREYFGLREGQNIMGFAAELKELTPEAKTELATEAAKQLGVTLKD